MNFLILSILMILPPIPNKITPELTKIMGQVPPAQKITVIVHMNAEYPAGLMAGLTAAERGTVMKEIAFGSQRDIVQYLSTLPGDKAEMGGRFWIFNGFHLRATRAVIEALARRDDVWFVGDNGTVQLENIKPTELSPRAAEWNIRKVQADSCWQAGFGGTDVILGMVDTGFMTTHEALSGKWLSPYWLDAVYGQPTPYDDFGHGTAVAGIICGGDGPGPQANDIGVAYGAKIIPTKAFDQNGSAQTVWLDSCLQYLADLRVSGIALRCVNNSWGTSTTTDLHWWAIMLNFKNIGVLPACAVGGYGPGPGTAGVPANYPTVIGIGATDSSDIIASFSARGPAPDQSPWNDSTYWYYPDWNLLKPDVSAPGVNVRTSYNNGGYVTYSGVSFSTGHVTGGVALFVQKDSLLTVSDLYYLFRDYCDQPSGGGSYPNNNYGWGRINLWRALQAVAAVDEGETGRAVDPHLSMKVYPTVLRGRVNIAYSIGQRAESIELKIFNITGRLVKSFTLGPMPLALCIVWNGDDEVGRPVASGVYFIKLISGDRTITRKVLILR
jgi:bacillopeptidase F